MIKRSLTAALLSANLLLTTSVMIPVTSFAQEVTPSPTPTIEATPTPPVAPTPPPVPTAPAVPTPPSTPQAPHVSFGPFSTPTPPPLPTFSFETPTPQDMLSGNEAASSAQFAQGTGSQHGSFGSGNNSVTTGDANVSGAMYNLLNGNTVNPNGNSSGSGTGGNSGLFVGNDGNGGVSQNNANGTLTNSNNINLSNNADLTNNFSALGDTGGNNASFNNGNGSVDSGNATVSGTVVNGVNTNVFGATEFTVAGDHVGDITLSPTGFGIHCTANCDTLTIAAINNNNGAFSNNNASASATNTNNTSLSNNANLVNNIYLSAVTGNNSADFNTGGGGSVTTGDANLAANVVNFVNTNIVGGALFVFNIVGDFVGDIILPVLDGGSGGCCGGSSNANSNNGAGSTNNASSTRNTTNNTTMTNDATITNTIALNGNTGANDANFNVGSSSVDTGNVDLSTNVVTVANVNAASDSNKPIWLIFVNVMGEWVGQIFDSAPGSTMAASDGIQFSPGSGGETNASNTGNGAYSSNTANATQNNTTNTAMNNAATITNNITLKGDTGHNSTGFNTGGTNNITTGNVNGAVNVVNLVNNNFAGRPVYIGIINVFGKWIGSVVDKAKPKSTAVTDQLSSQNQGNNSSSMPTPTPPLAIGGSNATTGTGDLGPTAEPANNAATNDTGSGGVTKKAKGLIQFIGSNTDTPNGPTGQGQISGTKVVVAGAGTNAPSGINWWMMAVAFGLLGVAISVKTFVTPKLLPRLRSSFASNQ